MFFTSASSLAERTSEIPWDTSTTSWELSPTALPHSCESFPSGFSFTIIPSLVLPAALMAFMTSEIWSLPSSVFCLVTNLRSTPTAVLQASASGSRIVAFLELAMIRTRSLRMAIIVSDRAEWGGGAQGEVFLEARDSPQQHPALGWERGM